MHRFRPATLLLIALCCTACFAEAVAQVPEALRACVSQKEDSRRLACYDREIAQLDKPAEVSAALPPAAAVAATEEGFGLPREVPKEGVDRRKAEQVQGKVAGIVSRPHGERVVTLDNGQVWAQKSPDLSIRLKVGDEVTIKRGAFGSYLLVASGRSTTVMRLQ
mgnify:FL=1